MTREEAIEVLSQDLPCEHDTDLIEALKIAIRALEQEPSGDCISRQALQEWIKDKSFGDIVVASEHNFDCLPPVKPQLCEDAISRQALLDDLGMSEKTRKWGGDHSGYNTMMLYEIQDVIESQPSVKPLEKTGHWKRISMDKYSEHAKYWYRCDRCGKDNLGNTDWCPNCGCRMVEPQESEDKE